MSHLLHGGKLCGLAFAPITFWVNVLFFLSSVSFFSPPLSGYDSASQFLVPGILIAVGMLLLVIFVVLAVFCLRWEQGGKKKKRMRRRQICMGKKTTAKTTGNVKEKGWGKPKTTMTPILQFGTTLFFCLYLLYLINGRFALCYPQFFSFFLSFFPRLWNSSDTKQRLWFLSLTQLKAILLIRTFSWGFIVWVNSVGCHHGRGAREKVHRSG